MRRLRPVVLPAAALLLAGAAAVAPSTATAADVSATLVATRLTSTWAVPSPDPAGITYRPDVGRLLITDSEVNEMTIYKGVNIFGARLNGAADPAFNGTTLPHSNEPTGAGIGNSSKSTEDLDTLFVSDDDADTVFMFTKGADGVHGTKDDKVTRFHTRSVGNTDAEGVDVDVANNGHVYVVDGLNNDVFDYFWGPNERFDGVAGSAGCRAPCDDTVTSFDVGAFGATDPEGIEYNAARKTLLVLEHKTKTVYEVTTTGALLNRISIASAGATNPAGITLAPASNGSGAQNMYVVDRGVDNDTDPNENDGKFYELAMPPLAPLPGQNAAPTVSAGPDLTVTLPAAATLDGSVTDPDGPAPLTRSWTTVSGPGTVTFADATKEDTTASFSAAGTYLLRLTGTDDLKASASDDVQVVVSAAPSGGGGGGTPATMSVAVSAGSDDVEQRGTSVNLSSADLSMGTDGGTAQTVGMRFPALPVPQGATVSRAWVQFTVDETNAAAASLRFRAEAADSAGTYTTGSGPGSRTLGSASATWSAPVWPTVGAAGADQRSVDLAAVVQQVVNRPGWASGNALALVVDGTGERTAKSLEGKAAPVLTVEYGGGSTPPPPPPPTNQPPVVTATAPSSVTLPATASLDGSVTDSDGPPPLTQQWTKVSGPGTVTFDAPAAQDTTAAFSAAGTYVLRLTGTDGAPSSSSADVTVVVNPAPPPGGGGGGGGGTPGTTSQAVAVGADDAEERSGSVNLTSADLSLGSDAGRVQTVGLRFAGLAVPPGATITAASVQFTVDETNTAPASLQFRAQAADTAPAFTTAAGNVSSRPLTAASATWAAPTWPTLLAAGPDQRSVDLAAVVQEVVSRPGWASGNALALVVSGSGERTARSFEGKNAPVLHVTFTS